MKAGVSNEAKTGIFIVLCLAVFVVLAMKVGNFSFTKKGYPIQARFHFTGGVKMHAPVSLSGVEVGEVSDIRLIYGDETLVELELWIREGVKIRKDSTALATTYGLMGEKYIEIQAGTAEAEYAASGDTIAGKDSFRMDEFVDIGKKLAKEVEKTVQDIGQTARDVSVLTKRMDGVVGDNRKKIDQMMDNFMETSENFREFSDDLKYHPWKVLMKGREVPREERERARLAKIASLPAKAEVPPTPVKNQHNFAKR